MQLRKLLEVTDMLMVSEVHGDVQTYQTVYIKYVQIFGISIIPQ